MAKKDEVVVLSKYYRPRRDMLIKYDDIVDRSNFVSTAEMIRSKRAPGNSGAGDKGLYDYEPNTVVTDENRISDVELLVRSGKLDKADVQKLAALRSEEFKNENDKKLLEAEDKANKERQAKLDKLIDSDFDSSQSES